MNTKTCTKCNKDKPLSDYYKIKKSGYIYSYCRKCHYEKMTKHTAAQWRKDNKEQWLADVHKAQKAYWNRQKAGVYLLITNKGLYVGATDKIRSRVSQHASSKYAGNIKAKGANLITWFVLEVQKDKKKRLAAEKKWIKILNPILNKIHTPRYIHWTKKG